MADHDKIRRLFEQQPGTWFSVVDIADKCGCQHNSVHRALKVQLADMNIKRRQMRSNRSRKEYMLSSEAHSKLPTSDDKPSWDPTPQSGIEYGVMACCGASKFFESKLKEKRGDYWRHWTECAACGRKG